VVLVGRADETPVFQADRGTFQGRAGIQRRTSSYLPTWFMAKEQAGQESDSFLPFARRRFRSARPPDGPSSKHGYLRTKIFGEQNNRSS